MTNQSSRINLSIIVPIFNEEEGVEYAIKQIYKDAASNPIKNIIDTFEVIAVDDGSSDNTYKILQHLKKSYKDFRIIKHHSNEGLGASIITGVKYSTKSYVTYLPADGQAFLREIYKGLELSPVADLVLTYRGARKDYNFYRQMLSSTLMICMKIFFNLNFRDYNWVHIYRRDLFKSIKVKSKGVFYLAEIVVRANEKKYKILEAQAKYHPRSTGYSKNARLVIVIKTLMDLYKLWIELKFRFLLK